MEYTGCTQYIPKDEIVRLIVRIQNVGEGETESVLVNVIENRTYTTPDFSGEITFPAGKVISPEKSGVV